MANIDTTIEALPLEILLSICHHLPTSSAAALSLTSKTILSKIGRRYTAELHGEYADKYETGRFLRLLSRDIPHLWPCVNCLCLHKHHWAKSSETRDLKKCVMETEDEYVQSKCFVEMLDIDAERQLFSGHEDLTWKTLNDFMRTNTAGHGLSQRLGTLDIAQSEFQIFPRPESMQFRISYQGQLVMREVRCYHNHQMIDVFICPHVFAKSRQIRAGSTLPAILKCAYSHEKEADQHGCGSCGGLLSCNTCPTEFSVMRTDEESTEHVRGLTGIILTRWLNLGDLSDPFEPFWRSHLDSRILSYPDQIGEALSSAGWEPGSIAAAWEQNWL